MSCHLWNRIGSTINPSPPRCFQCVWLNVTATTQSLPSSSFITPQFSRYDVTEPYCNRQHRKACLSGDFSGHCLQLRYIPSIELSEKKCSQDSSMPSPGSRCPLSVMSTPHFVLRVSQYWQCRLQPMKLMGLHGTPQSNQRRRKSCNERPASQ